MNGIYIHIPFCEKRCAYCAFCSSCDLKEKDRYISKLLQEIESFNLEKLDFNENLLGIKENTEPKKVDTVYLGGGTPSLLEEKDLEKIFNLLHKKFEIEKNSEISIECNPNSLTEEKLKFYKQVGINRLSIGVQSLDDRILKVLGRLHTSSQALLSVQLAKKYFDNVSVDMLVGVNGQSEEAFTNELSVLAKLGAVHFSTYMLQVEVGTPLARQIKENPFLLTDEDEIIQIYQRGREFLQERDFVQYEISNFAKKGRECKHNIKYWTGENYYGFGMSAHSYINGIRSAKAKNFEAYYDGNKILYEKLTKEQLIEEAVMLGLRNITGVKVNYIKKLGYDIEKNENFEDFIKKDIIKKENGRIFLNPAYYGASNYIIVKLLN